MYRFNEEEGRVSNTGRAIAAGILTATGSVVFIEPAPYDLIAILFAVWFFSTGLKFPRNIALPLLLLALFAIGNAIAALASDDPVLTFRSLSIRMYMVLTWVLVVSLIADQPRRVLQALWTGYLFASVIAVAWGTLEYFGFLPGESWTGGSRAKGGFKDPNVFGPFLAPAAIYAIHSMTSAVRIRKLLFGGLFLAFAFGILISFSRGAWINFTVSTFIYWILLLRAPTVLNHKLSRLNGGVAIGAIVCLFLMAAVSIDVIGERFSERAVLVHKYDITATENVSIGRFEAQSSALRHIGQDPVGLGPGRSFDRLGLEPHNVYLHIAVEGGWLAGLSFIVFLVYTGYRLPDLRRGGEFFSGHGRIVTACMAGLLVQSLFIDSTHWRHLWLLLAVSWGLIIAAGHSRSVRMMSPTDN
jgi:hypothetical protein